MAKFVGLAVAVVLGGVALFTAVEASAQVQCRMPNGVVITQQLGTCPRDAVLLDAAGVPVVVPQVSVAAPAPIAAPVTPTRPTKPARADEVAEMTAASWFWAAVMVAALVFVVVRSLRESTRQHFCTSCGSQGAAKRETRGYLLIEIVLWLCFLIPGLIYSIWRQSSKYKACGTCGARTLVPPGSPMAVAAKRMFQRQ